MAKKLTPKSSYDPRPIWYLKEPRPAKPIERSRWRQIRQLGMSKRQAKRIYRGMASAGRKRLKHGRQYA